MGGKRVRTGQRSGQNERLRQANAGRWFSVVVQAARDLWASNVLEWAASLAFFLLAQGVFALAVDRIWANLSLLYGPLAIAALFLTWAWYVALITLVGGALASHVKVMILEGSSAQQAGRDHVDRTSS